MSNPLAEQYDETSDRELVQQSVGGDRKALDALIRRHQPYIYNVAWKMVHDPDDAWDLTQEALLKVVTNLGQFRFESSLRTWMYRIVLNHFLVAKRRHCEDKVTDFEGYGAQLDALPDPVPTPAEEIELQDAIEEGRIRCMSGMLLCLSREQRLVFTLAEMFGVGDELGGELLDISPANFRVRLHRARKDLFAFMNRKCGLVNKRNPCRCRNKTKALIDAGLVDSSDRRFHLTHMQKVRDIAPERLAELSSKFDEGYVEQFRTHRFDSTATRVALADLLAGGELEELFAIE